jgi:hypothetical protein
MIDLNEQDAYENYHGKRVRVVWNPEVKKWFVYPLSEDEENNRMWFSATRLELHTVGVFGDIKPSFAPQGSPSFVGTVARHSTLPDNKSKPLTAHPYVPSQLFVGDADDGREFTHGRRVLVDGSTVICRLP